MAVYTEVSDDALASFLAEYDIGAAIACKGIAEGVENSNFALRTTAGDYILTLYEKRVERGDLPYFLGLMEHLANRGVGCPRPVVGRDGASLRELCGRAAAMTTFLPGIWPRHVRVEHCTAVGAALARLHRSGLDYAPMRPNALGPSGWADLLARCAAHPDIAATPAGLLAELHVALTTILAAWPDARDLPVGQIHADLFPDNVFFLDGQLSGLIDFYFAATDLLAYDLAVCLNAWCFSDDGVLLPGHAAAMVAGYCAVRPLEAAERRALTALCQGAALRFALTRLYDWLATPPGALVTRKDPMEYVRRLRVHLAISDATAYGA